jgi:hypothetical protein
VTYRRGKRHDQREVPAGTVCKNCQDGQCSRCVDVPRAAAGYTDELCNCRRQGHDGEPVYRQVKDPETETVYAPGVHILKSGTVVRE